MAKSTAVPDELLNAVREYGIDPSNVRRLIIDIQSGEVPVIHVELFSDDRSLEILRSVAPIVAEHFSRTVEAEDGRG